MGIFSRDSVKLWMPRLLSALLAVFLLAQMVPLFAVADDDTRDSETKSAAEEKASEETVSEETAPDETTPEEDVPDERVSEEIDSKETVSDETVLEKENERFFPDYTLDEYADVMYGTGTIKDNGCSVCCMAVVATYLTGHQYYPDELARWFGGKAENNVDRVRLMAEEFQLPMTEAENYDRVKEALREGKVVIQLMNGRSLFIK